MSFIGINGRNIDSNTYLDNSFPLNSPNPALYYNPATGSQFIKSIANPFYGYLTPSQFGALRNQKTVKVSQLLAPYPQYGQITEGSLPLEGDVVRNFEVQLQRQYSGGLTLLGSYLYNREWQTWFPTAGSDASSGYYLYNRTAAWSDSTGSPYARHRVVISGVYDLPFGRGRMMMASANRLLDGVLGGWTLSSTFTYNAGAQLNFGSGFAQIGDPSQNVPAGYAFNPTAFETLPPYSAQAPVRNFPGIYGPNNWDIDASLGKTFSITERWKIQFRMEAYNLTNSIMFSPPNTSIGNSTFGQVDQSQMNTGRTLQYAARLNF